MMDSNQIYRKTYQIFFECFRPSHAFDVEFTEKWVFVTIEGAFKESENRFEDEEAFIPSNDSIKSELNIYNL